MSRSSPSTSASSCSSVDLGLSGRKAFVGGASAGLGRACATALVGEGAEVALSARGAERLAQTCAALGVRAHAVPADLSRPEEAARAVSEAIARLGGLDVL